MRRKPGVSMAMKDLPSSSNRTSTLSRVVPGTSLTIIRSAWQSVLTKRALARVPPAHDRQLHERLFGGHFRRRGGGQSLANRLQQIVLAAVLVNADPHDFPAQTVELVGLRVQTRARRSCWPRRSPGRSHSASRRATSSSSGTKPSRVSTMNRITAAESIAVSICSSMCSVRLSGSSTPMPPVSTSST